MNLKGGAIMTDEELQKELLVTQIRSLIEVYVERFGSNPYVSLDFNLMSVTQLATIRRNLHEAVYAPPPRSR